MSLKALEITVFPQPGLPSKSTLCPPVAAMIRALLAASSPAMFVNSPLVAKSKVRLMGSHSGNWRILLA